jgi:NAD(P)-dependent dehydrogenase (short-subunit alcohol dehydrogenase family)
MSDFAGLRAFVTGGASGIGLAAATLLADRGASVAVLDRDIDAVPSGFVAVRADVTDDEAVRTAVAEAVDRLGGLDILVNNAGIGAQGTVEDNDDEEWHRVFDVSVVGLVRVARACLPTSGSPLPPPSSTPVPSPRPPACRTARCTAGRRARCSRSPWRWPPITSGRACA